MRCSITLAVMVAAGAPVLQAQGKFPPDSFTNLKVLPKTIGKQELLATMRGFALGLGVRCTYCHVGREGAPLDSVKFAADDKRTKRAEMCRREPLPEARSEKVVACLASSDVEQSTIVGELQAKRRVGNQGRINAR